MIGKDLKPLKQSEIKKKLKGFPGWKFTNNKISKEFVFKSFSRGVIFIRRLAPFCNRIDHHPDIHVYYKKVLFELQRFSIGGKVTERDFTVAREIERLYGKEPKN
ncbi:4a-hydroxytetrahydrobiopterin dehydratase [Candidatus Woesebacteria bacterium]|nr:4a-hydroxytetrahydrobiopterin dehydratase [Candidatus Woesebacteria bacterium]